jgi:hypothetical protein
MSISRMDLTAPRMAFFVPTRRAGHWVLRGSWSIFSCPRSGQYSVAVDKSSLQLDSRRRDGDESDSHPHQAKGSMTSDPLRPTPLDRFDSVEHKVDPVVVRA